MEFKCNVECDSCKYFLRDSGVNYYECDHPHGDADYIDKKFLENGANCKYWHLNLACLDGLYEALSNDTEEKKVTKND